MSTKKCSSLIPYEIHGLEVPFPWEALLVPAVIECCGNLALESVFAYTTKTSASGPFVIQNLVPFKMYLLPTFCALSFMETTSVPELASLIAKAPKCSPEHN
uniref:Uncharacterized protein n=1 Tax=Romanomermis culicivorax TaxID=13658 RepID=A0A915IU46_ROMCU